MSLPSDPVVPSGTPVLNYEPARSRSSAVWHYLCAVWAFGVMCWIVVVSFKARVTLATSVDGGRAQAWAALHYSAYALMAMALLWIGARRSFWANRRARTSFVIALIWWLYVNYKVHGGRITWYW
jgi:hypothetical protein